MRAHAACPVVSVVMPVYNGARWLEAAVESVFAQTLSSLEVVIVDDASQDDSAIIARRLAEGDPRVRVLRHSTNRGQAAARNLAIAAARGVWIAPVDVDDEIHPDRLRTLAEAGERGQADLIADGILFQNAAQPGAASELMTWRRQGNGLESLTPEALIRSGTGGECRSLGFLKPLIRRRFLEESGLRYSEELRFAEDFNLYVRALFCGARFLLYPESHYVYWQRAGSASRADMARKAAQALANCRHLRRALPREASAELISALDEYEERWKLLTWFDQVKRGVAGRHVPRVIGLLFNLPTGPRRVLRFARDRAALKRLGTQG